VWSLLNVREGYNLAALRGAVLVAPCAARAPMLTNVDSDYVPRPPMPENSGAQLGAGAFAAGLQLPRTGP
jgi:hypothetical protein